MASDKRIKVTLACSECKQRNYNTMKNKKKQEERSRPSGNEQVLPLLQEAHQPQGNQVKAVFRS